MGKNLNDLYQFAMKPLIESESEAKTHKFFFTQKEFEKNMGEIFIITGARRKIEEKIHRNDQ